MRHAVSFMPYFPDEQINQVLGDFRVWNWTNNKKQFATDKRVEEYLTRYFALYKTVKGKPERRIAIVSPAKGDPFPPDQDLFKLSRFNNALMACYLFNLPLDQNWPLCLSDNFTGLQQPFDADSDDASIAFKFGSYLQVTQAGSWDYLTFATPQFMPDMGQCKPVDRLMPLLLTLLADKSAATNRLFRSLEWLRLAFVNYENVPYDVRLVAMCSAFEALLDLPEFKKAENFSNQVNGLLPPNKLSSSSRPIRKTMVADTAVGWWCRDFYSLRSKLVHGEETKPQDWHHSTGTEHLKIAINIFEECVWGLLTKWSVLSPDDRMMEFQWRSNWRDMLGVQMSAFI
jgi:Apea-like HEPN